MNCSTLGPQKNLPLQALAKQIRDWAYALGFQHIGITDTHLEQDEAHLNEWLKKGYQGTMDYMARHGQKRSRPDALVPGTLRVISLRMDYLPPNNRIKDLLRDPNKAVIARYALGRDYHKVMRKRLKQLVNRIQNALPTSQHRVFVDSAPVLEKAIAQKAGLGWIGKHTNLINRHAGSWFFLGEIFTDIPLPLDQPTTAHCGSCTACIDVCPTEAIVGPQQLDARRCISYLTIEHRGSIPPEFRKRMGNRVYGCDDCQLICPWNRYAKATHELDFKPRHQLDSADLITLFLWSAEEFNQKTQGSAIRRIGYDCWLRNLAIGLGNAPYDPKIVAALNARKDHPSDLVREHVAWALNEQQQY